MTESAAESKRLSSHDSVYHALTDPMLDLSAPASPRGAGACVQDEEKRLALSVSPNPVQDAFFDSQMHSEDAFSLSTSWSVINAGENVPHGDLAAFSMVKSASRPSSASILSNSTDDDRAESMVIIPSFKTPSQILLFETDEEDEPEKFGVKRKALDFGDDASTLVSNLNASKPTILGGSSQFIMPRLSFAESVASFNLTIVSSDSSLILQEASNLKLHIETIENSNFTLKLSQVCLEKSVCDKHLRITRASDLVLIVNDGSLKIPKLLQSLKEGSGLPRFVVINMINSNYFINLLDIINVSTPQQIFKTSSLTSGKVLDRINDLITQEMTIFNQSSRPSGGVKDAGMAEKRKKAKYKSLEKSWKSEFGEASYHKGIDPFKITGALGRLGFVSEVLDRYIRSPSEKSWLLLSFAIGIGIGVTLSTFRFFDVMKAALFSSRPRNKVVAKVVPRKNISSLLATRATLIHDQIVVSMSQLLEDINGILVRVSASGPLAARALGDSIESRLSTGMRMIYGSLSVGEY